MGSSSLLLTLFVLLTAAVPAAIIYTRVRHIALVRRVDKLIQANCSGANANTNPNWRRVFVRSTRFARRWSPFSVAQSAGIVFIDDRSWQVLLAKPIGGQTEFCYPVASTDLSWIDGAGRIINNIDQARAWFQVESKGLPTFQIGSDQGAVDLFKQMAPGEPAPTLISRFASVRDLWPTAIAYLVLALIFVFLVYIAPAQQYATLPPHFLSEPALLVFPAAWVLFWVFCLRRGARPAGNSVLASLLVATSAVVLIGMGFAQIDRWFGEPQLVVYQYSSEKRFREVDAPHIKYYPQFFGFHRDELRPGDRIQAQVIHGPFGSQVDRESVERVPRT